MVLQTDKYLLPLFMALALAFTVRAAIPSTPEQNPTLRIAQEVLKETGEKNVELSIDTTGTIFSKSDAFRIKGRGGKFIISSPTPQGLLYGTMALQRIKSGAGVNGLDTVESPVYKLRLLNHWDNLDGTVERGYAGRSLWKWDELPVSLSPRYKEYALKCAEVGINGAVLNNVNASPLILSREYLVKVKALADFLRPYGIKTYLSVNFASPMAIDSLTTADPLSPDVARWWIDKTNEIYSLIPDFGGFLIKANSEGQPGPGDYGRTHFQGANMIADALAPHGGIVMWRSFVYAPSSDDRAKQAYLEFTPLDGKFRDNVIVQVKNGPVDFQPREPYNPLFGAMPSTPLMAELQITQEYLGQANHLAFLAPMWEEFFRMVHPSSVVGIAGVANIGDNDVMTGHPLADANRYAFGRLAWNPYLSSNQIISEWTDAHLYKNPAKVPEKVKADVNAMFIDSRETVVDYMMPLGLHHIFAGNHHYGPEPWYYVDGIREDWTPRYYHKADKSGLGFDRTSAGSNAVSQYPDSLKELYGNIDKCPEELLLWFHHVPWEHKMKSGNTLWDELCLTYQRGADKAASWSKVWAKATPYVDKTISKDVAKRFEIQAKDARWWRDACLLYFGQFSGLPLPVGVEPPGKTLEQYMEISLPLDLYTNPAGEMLDQYR